MRAGSWSTSQAEEVEEGEQQEKTSVSSMALPRVGRELEHVSSRRSGRRRRAGEDRHLEHAALPRAGRELEHVLSRSSSRRRRAGRRRRKKNQYRAGSWTSMFFFHRCGAEHLCVCHIVHGFFVMVVFLFKVLCRWVFILARFSTSVLGTVLVQRFLHHKNNY